MGCDLILYILPACEMNDEREKELYAIIDGTPQEDRPEYFAYDSQEEGVTHLKDILASYNEYYGRRDVVCCMRLGGKCEWLFAGGMSWGESPSEAADDFSMIEDWPGIYAKLEEYACTDAAEKRVRPNVAVPS